MKFVTALPTLLLTLLLPPTSSFLPYPPTTPTTTTTTLNNNAGPPYGGPVRKPMLDRVKSPDDMKGMSIQHLKQLSEELRWEVIEQVSKTGGHLGSSLGVIEMTVALHHVFSTPEDKIVWDVAHQCYPHKILTGRRDRMSTLRQMGGLSGFCKMKESPYDAFGAGHSSTSISAIQGYSIAKSQLNPTGRNNCIAVIGDGAITGGMAYEAMNSAGYLKNRMIVILNDNGQVSLPTGTASAGGTGPASELSAATSRLLVSKQFQDFRSVAKGVSGLFPENVQEFNKKIDEYARGIVSGGTLFEELGFYYVGPLDGHDLDNFVPILSKLRDSPSNKPVLLHVKTNKGNGYPPAENASDKMHGVAKFDVATGVQKKGPKGPPSLTSVFANELCTIASTDKRVVGITAAMPGGTGMDIFGRRFPDRTYDVGIAEQHAVTMAAAMSAEGLKPFVCIYSTFLQRGFDQVVHDVAIQNLPVRLILDRAGLVGNDGPTHHGAYDLSYLGCIPNLTICGPSDEVELKNMIQTAAAHDDGPIVVRYPRGAGYGEDKLKTLFGYDLPNGIPEMGEPLEIGKGRIVRTSTRNLPRSQSVTILSFGTRLHESLVAAAEIEAAAPDLSVTVADARFMKPLDVELVRSLASEHSVIVTVEENSIGGFGDSVLHFLSLEGLLDNGDIRFRPMVLPDTYFEAGPQFEQYEQAGLNAKHITGTILRLTEKITVPIAV